MNIRKPESLLLFSSTILAKKSGWLKEKFEEWEEDGHEYVNQPWTAASCVKYFLVCCIDGSGRALLLLKDLRCSLDDSDFQHQLNGDLDCSREPHTSTPSRKENGAVGVKQEPREHTASTSPDIPQLISSEERNITFFTLLGGRPKELDKRLLLPDGGLHVASLDSLVRHSKVYEAVPALREALHRLFYPRMPTLFEAIAQDPPLWLVMACTLEDSIIFKEAVVHIVGCLPQWPWSTPRVEVEEELVHGEAVLAMMEEKANALTLRKYEVDDALFQNTLKASRGGPIQLDKKNAWRFQVISLWRDWFCQQLAETTSPDKSYVYDRTKVASVYRTIQDGGDAYLETENVLARLRDVLGANKDKEEQCRNDLKVLKAYASMAVGKLMATGLQLKREGQLGYLTSVEVTEEDCPWEDKDEDMDD